MILLRLKEEEKPIFTKSIKVVLLFFIKRVSFKVKQFLIVFFSYKIMYTSYEFLFVDKFRENWASGYGPKKLPNIIQKF